MAGIGIVAIDKKGKRFTTQTDEHGAYTLYLPLNRYSLQVETTTLPDKYLCEHAVRDINLFAGQRQQAGFVVTVENRKVDIKKFRSSSMGP